MTTKTLDNKGRITLGAEYAGQTVIVDDSNPGYIIIKPAKVIPTSEAWLYENEVALKQVRRGLKEARSGEFAKNPPDVQKDEAWLED